MKISRQTIKVAVLTAALAGGAGQALQAQTENYSNKRELLLHVLDQSRENDYVPVFFNIHFAEKGGWGAVKSHIDWFRQTHVDFVNVKYEYFPEIQPVKRVEDWSTVKPFDPSVWEEQLLVVRELRRELGGEALIIPTVFSPLRVLIQTVGAQLSSDREGRAKVVKLIKKNPEAIKPALEAVTQSLTDYIRAARLAGADGFYISSQGDTPEELGGGVFADIVRPYDIRLSEVAAEVAPFNILHICEAGGTFTPESIRDYRDYPGSVVNAPVHNWQSEGMTLREISDFFHRPVLGGLKQRGALYSGTLEEAKAEVDEIMQSAPRNFIFGADCSLPNDSDPEKIRQLVDYIHNWRINRKQK